MLFTYNNNYPPARIAVGEATEQKLNILLEWPNRATSSASLVPGAPGTKLRPLHELEAPVQKAGEKEHTITAAPLFCQHYIDLCTANTVPADFN